MPATPEKTRRSSQKSSNRRKKGRKNKARKLAAPVPGVDIEAGKENPIQQFRRSIPDSPYSTILCPICDNLGMFTIAGDNGPALLRYCECAHGSQMVALMIELASGLRVKQADRLVAARHATFWDG
ncbi:MAG TPA: hypothetical protein VI756_14370 [Blastocatellia bacterium]